MPAVEEVRVPARSTEGEICGYLRIALLPQNRGVLPAPLLDAGKDAVGEELQSPIQLLEGHEYRYEWEEVPVSARSIATDPKEAFQPDTTNGLKGRLRPGLSTGTLQVQLRSGELTLGQLELEVRSRKLNYLSEYRWMLKNIADQMTELVMDRFAASSTSFIQKETHDAVTLYQRFAFLRALITSESFQFSLSEITRNPHVAWENIHETVGPGQPIRSSSYTIRQLSRPGTRMPWPEGPIASIPLRLDRRCTESTHDTIPNRFVRFALERWRQVVADIETGLKAIPTNSAVARGLREVAHTLVQLDEILHHDLFKDLGPITRFPADNQVLQRREGYRDVYRAYLEFELAAKLSLRGAEASYAAGQRDVATLYEYWSFLQMAQLVATLAGKKFDLKPLLETRSDSLNIVLKAGKLTVLSGVIERLGRRMAIELCFNRTFGKGSAESGSWSRRMRPDISLIITAPPDEKAAFEPVVLHFDAKYKVNFIDELFGNDEEIVSNDSQTPQENVLRRSGPLSVDLLKMHAYRDAIRRTAGAYVLYPGDEPDNRVEYLEYRELLPGLGAFVLRPSPDGDAIGIVALRSFLDEVFSHVAMRLTHHERGRYWLEEIYGAPKSRPLVSTSTHPGPDTTVLLGYVKNAAHWHWIHKTKAYNLRTENRRGGVAQDAELLYSQLLLLYCPETQNTALARIVSGPELVEVDAMAATGYPDPSSDYLCVQLSWVTRQEFDEPCSAKKIDQLVLRMGQQRGKPTAVRWAELKGL
jgi:predicted component of viral defense system (DUF524 family)